jgi:aryl-alcohol dehydrogenase-like predicted oxidoreductase
MENVLLRETRIPGTELRVPYATVGVMMFGKRADEAESARIVDKALDLGLNFFDTADMYQDGESERILGRALKGRRDQCVVASKAGYGKDEAGKEEGLSATALRRAVDGSLERLGMNCIDIYYFHRPDPEVPVEESLQTMADIIQAGKVRHLGISNHGAWQSLQMIHLCETNGWPRPVITQMIYNPLMRQIEYEYTRLAAAHDLYLTVYNPLAGGLLTGKYASLKDEDKGGRFQQDNARYRKRYWSERFFQGMLGLKAIADAEGMSLTHLTLGWIAQQSAVNNILLGPSNLDQLLDCVQAGEKTISDQGMEKINAFLAEFDGTDASYAR